MVDRVAHRDRQLHLPVFCAGIDDDTHHFAELRHHGRCDLGVDARDQADAPAIVEHTQCLKVRARHAAQMVMQGLQAIDRDAKAAKASVRRRLDHVARQLVAAGLHRAVDAMVADRAHDGQPVPADEGFTADD